MRSSLQGAIYRNAVRRGPVGSLAGRILRAQGERSLADAPNSSAGTPTAERINRILSRTLGASYLEIGLKHGATLEGVDAPVRVGVEPEPRFNPWPRPSGIRLHLVTSDEYFAASTPPRDGFDLVFLDGLHEFRQTYRDLLNATRQLAPGGLILIDDVVPSSRAAAAPTQAEAKRLRDASDTSREWMGDVFKVMWVLQEQHPQLVRTTVVDAMQRPQALVRPMNDLPLADAPPSLLAAADALDYDDIFGAGIPEWFNPLPLDAALEYLLGG